MHTLITDINNRDKFLGNLILNCISDYYEIVDGQQRVTTILLILLALFNKRKSDTGSEHNEEQRNLLRYIFKPSTDTPVLENESIGSYITLQDNEIKLTIDDSKDIYYQKEIFKDLYGSIIRELDMIDDLDQFQKKVMDCQLLILFGDTRGRQNDSIEEVFLDINFKSQLLDVADIFKGYCFKNYQTSYHDELKEQWTNIRKCMKGFEPIGYVNTTPHTDGCPYLYLYLLSRPETYDIPVNLSYNGKHHLEGKSHTETKKLLIDMAEYGGHILGFIKNLSNEEYFFDDICSDAAAHKSDFSDLQRLKAMYKDIMGNTKVQYYKLPLFMVLHYLLKRKDLRDAFPYKTMKKFLTNYYVYSVLFINKKGNKSKTNIDRTIFTKLYQIDQTGSSIKAEDVVAGLLKAVKELRREYVDQYTHPERFNDKMAEAVYSLMDHYSASDNYLKLLYRAPEYTKEHLIAHDNRAQSVTWVEADNQFSFKLKELMGTTNGTTYRTYEYRKLSANYIILPKGLNESLGHDDIVQKVYAIKKHYADTRQNLPIHVHVFLSYIETMNEFKNLSALKGQKKSQDEIKSAYRQFVTAYFDEKSKRELNDKLGLAFKGAFVNLTP